MMEFLQELFVTASVAIVLSFIVAISIAVSGGEQKIVGEKIVGEEVKSDKGLKVVGAKSEKRVKFLDDVEVKNVDHFEGVEESIKDFEISEKLSEKLGFLDQSFEGAIIDDKSDEAEIIKVVDQLEGKVDKESEVMLYGEELLEECDDMIREVHGAAEDKGSKDAGLLDKVFEGEVLAEKSEDIKVDEYYCSERKTEVASGLEPLDVALEMKTEEVDDGSGLLDEALDSVAADEKNTNAEINVGRFSGGKESNIVLGGSENLVFEERMKSQGLGSESRVQMMKYDITSPEYEEDGVVGFVENDEVGTGEGLSKGNEVVEGLVRNEDIDDDDDWEGIERSELEKVFAEAVNYVEYGGKGKDDLLANLASDVQMKLYGLHKVAIEGPCHEPQPMALKVSARAKWNAWKRLGSMSADVAMENYIELLSDADPGWMQHSSADDGKHGIAETGLTGGPEAESHFLQDSQADTEEGQKLQLNTH